MNFCLERVNKIGGDSILRYSGKNLAELDQVLEYLMTTYIDYTLQFLGDFQKLFTEFPDGCISTFHQFVNILGNCKVRPHPTDVSKLYLQQQCRIESGKIGYEDFIDILKKNDLCAPFVLDPSHPPQNQLKDDVSPFMNSEAQFYEPLYDKLVEESENRNDDVLQKQIRSAKLKFEQALGGKPIGRTFQNIHREFYEKLILSEIYLSAV